MSLTFAGVPLSVWTPDWDRFCSTSIPLDEYRPFSAADWYWRDLSPLNLPPPPVLPPVRPGVLWWPRGASRWATAHLAVTNDMLAAIRGVVGLPRESGGSVGELVYYDGQGTGPVSALMHLLPPRPISGPFTRREGPVGENYSWLMTLVDDRYFWWFRPVKIETRPSSWADLFAKLSLALSITLTGDTDIPAVFGQPSSRWVVKEAPAGVLLDAAAECVGRRVVRRLDGTVRLERWDTALALDDFQYTGFQARYELRSDIPSPSGKGVVSGYVRTGDGRTRAGGRLLHPDLGRAVPESLDCVFAASVSGGGQTVVRVPLTAFPDLLTGVFPVTGIDYPGGTVSGVASGFGTPYAGVVSAVGRFLPDLFTSMSGGADVSGAAYALASSWFGWQLADMAVVYNGVPLWVPSAASESVQWEYVGDDMTTRIERPPYWNPCTYDPGGGGGVAVSDNWRFGLVLDGTDPGPYIVEEVALYGPDDWQPTTDPPTVLSSLYRPPSVLAPPDIDAGQTILFRAAANAPGYYEMTPWGSVVERSASTCLAIDLTAGCDASGVLITIPGIQLTATAAARDLASLTLGTETPCPT